MRLKSLLSLGLFALLLCRVAGGQGLEVYWNFESAVDGKRLFVDETDRDYTGQARSTRGHGVNPKGSTDVPAQIRDWSKGSLDMQQGMVYFALGAKVELHDFTLNLWLKPEQTQERNSALVMRIGSWLISNIERSNTIEFRSYADNQILRFKPALKNNQWQMLTLRYADQTQEVELFVNGESLGVQKLDMPLKEGRAFYVGTSDTSGRFAYAGLVADFSLYSAALDKAAVDKLYAGTEPRLVHRQQPPLKRIATQPFTAAELTYEPKRSVDLMKADAINAVIVRPERKIFDEAAEKVQALFRKHWGVQVPIVDAGNLPEGDATLIIIGDKRSSALARELAGNGLLEGVRSGYELRTVPEALDWKRDVLYIGGATQADVVKGAEQFFKQFAKPQSVAHFIKLEDVELAKLPTPEQLLSDLQKLYDTDTIHNKLQVTINSHLSKAAEAYRKTGDDAYARAYGDMLKIYADGPKSHKGEISSRNEQPPSFAFHQLVQGVWLVEQSPAFTAEDRALAAELMRDSGEQMMDYWEMATPIKLYEQGKTGYMTNHPIFACRSMSTVGRYLLSRHNYEPAKYWKTVADNGMDGVAPHPYSPEDAGGYQYLVYTIFMDYAVSSGRYGDELFTSETFRRYVDDTKAQINHLGYMPGNGDAYPQYMMGAYPILIQAVNILGDEEAEFMLGLVAQRTQWDAIRDAIGDAGMEGQGLKKPGIKAAGMRLIELVPFKERFYLVRGLLNLPALDKAIFRSGWEPTSDYLAINGLNDADHGHIEASAINQYIQGDRLWLFDGDYIRKYADDHNTVIVSKNGAAPDQRFRIMERSSRTDRVSQIVGASQTQSRRLAALSLLVQNLGGMNWKRHIGYEALGGFWTIDRLEAIEEADYRARVVWRVTGNMEERAQAMLFSQKPSQNPEIASHLSITEGTGAQRTLETRFERGHARKDGYLLDAERVLPNKNTNYILQDRAKHLNAGESFLFVNYVKPLPGASPVPVQVRRLADNAFLATDNGVNRFAALGAYSGQGISVDAEVVFISEEGISAVKLKQISIGSQVWRSEQEEGQDISFDADQLFGGPSAAELQSALKGLANAGATVEPVSPRSVAVAEGAISVAGTFDAPVSALAGDASGFGVGTAKGSVVLFDARGNETGQKQYKSEVSAMTAINDGGKTLWAAGFFPEVRNPGDSPLRAFDGSGRELWQTTIPAFNRRNGTPRTMFPAVLKARGPQSLIVGSESQRYYAFDAKGKELWRHRITHGATAGAAGDMTGDGRDDIAAGGEYYYHVLLNADGEQLGARQSTAPWNECVVVADLNGDGKKEAFYGRSDSWVYVQAPKENSIRNWSVNVGGRPLAITTVERSKARLLAVATAMGEVVFIDATGKIVDRAHLPAAISDLIEFRGSLFAVCLDGFVYQIGADAKINRKYPYTYDWTSTTTPRLAASGQSVGVASGRNFYLINN